MERITCTYNRIPTKEVWPLLCIETNAQTGAHCLAVMESPADFGLSCAKPLCVVAVSSCAAVWLCIAKLTHMLSIRCGRECLQIFQLVKTGVGDNENQQPLGGKRERGTFRLSSRVRWLFG